MEPPVFYAPPENMSGDVIELPTAESHHAWDVFRVRPGSEVVVVDGLGRAYQAEVTKRSTARQVWARVHQTIPNYGEPRLNLTLAVGVAKGFKMDTVVEKGTELGVSRFVPVVSARSQLKLDDPSTAVRRRERWERVALAAMKQCRRSLRPEISVPLSFGGLLEGIDSEQLRLICQPGSDGTPLRRLPLGDRSRRVTVLVGPEAGFSADEFQAARRAGWEQVRLGVRILRAETAGPTVSALIMAAAGELD